MKAIYILVVGFALIAFSHYSLEGDWVNAVVCVVTGLAAIVSLYYEKD